MCGIFGFIGKSRNPKVSFDLSNALMIKTEIRGDHATGFWSCERGDSRLFYDKEPVKSSAYVHRQIWAKTFSQVDADLLIAHCRYTSMNVGHERFNKNNHPHASADKRVALVHNGRIPEYNILKSRYNLKSDCDSEILLGMFEAGEEYKDKTDFLKEEFPKLSQDVAYRMCGLKEVFSRVNYGAMSVAIGERADNTTGRFLWLFRDDERPLHVIDMRDTLGQIFFCSTAEIWRSSVESCPSVKDYISSKHQIIECPPYQVWMMNIEQKEGEDEWRIKKFKITKAKFYDWKQEDDVGVIPRPLLKKPITTLITRLDENEEVIKEKVVASTSSTITTHEHTVRVVETSKKKIKDKNAAWQDMENDVNQEENDEYIRRNHTEKDVGLEELSEILESSEIDMKAFDEILKEIRGLVNSIETTVKTQHNEQSISDRDFTVIMESLKDVQAELKGSIIFVK